MKTDLYHRVQHSISPNHVELIGSMLPTFLSEEDRTALEKDWVDAGSYATCPWWKWCLEHMDVIYDKKSSRRD